MERKEQMFYNQTTLNSFNSFCGFFQLLYLRPEVCNDGTVGGIGFFIFLEAVLEFGNLARLGGNGSGAAGGSRQMAMHENPDDKREGVEAYILLAACNNGIEGGAGDTCGICHFLVSDALFLHFGLDPIEKLFKGHGPKEHGAGGSGVIGAGGTIFVNGASHSSGLSTILIVFFSCYNNKKKGLESS